VDSVAGREEVWTESHHQKGVRGNLRRPKGGKGGGKKNDFFWRGNVGGGLTFYIREKATRDANHKVARGEERPCNNKGQCETNRGSSFRVTTQKREA